LKPSACNEKVVKEDEILRRKNCFNPIPFFICSKKCHQIQKKIFVWLPNAKDIFIFSKNVFIQFSTMFFFV